MQLITVDSSMIQALGYDPQEELLEVVFTSGKTYRYINVPQETYNQLMASSSKGSYMRSCIIGMFPEQRISSRRRR